MSKNFTKIFFKYCQKYVNLQHGFSSKFTKLLLTSCTPDSPFFYSVGVRSRSCFYVLPQRQRRVTKQEPPSTSYIRRCICFHFLATIPKTVIAYYLQSVSYRRITIREDLEPRVMRAQYGKTRNLLSSKNFVKLTLQLLISRNVAFTKFLSKKCQS